jgi:hypothetical protein
MVMALLSLYFNLYILCQNYMAEKCFDNRTIYYLRHNTSEMFLNKEQVQTAKYEY